MSRRKKKIAVWLSVALIIGIIGGIPLDGIERYVELVEAANGPVYTGTADVTNADMDFSSTNWEVTLNPFYQNSDLVYPFGGWAEIRSFIKTSDDEYVIAVSIYATSAELLSHLSNAKLIAGGNAEAPVCVWFRKFDAQGNIRWDSVIEGSGTDPNVFELSDGNLIVFDFKSSGTKQYTILNKNTGDLVKRLRDTFGLDVLFKRLEQGYLGYTNNKDGTITMGLHKKIYESDNPYGAIGSRVILDVSSFGNITDAVLDSDNHYVLVGNSKGKYAIEISKYDSTGVRTANYQYSNQDVSYVEDPFLEQTPDGGYLVGFSATWKDSTIHLRIKKFSSSLEPEWEKEVFKGCETGRMSSGGEVGRIRQIDDSHYLVGSRVGVVLDEDGKVYNVFERAASNSEILDIYDDGAGNYVYGTSCFVGSIPKKTFTGKTFYITDIDGTTEGEDGNENENGKGEEDTSSDSGIDVSHLYNDYLYQTKVADTGLTVYANGSKDYKTATVYTDILASYIYKKNSKGKLTASTGKVVAGITTTSSKPTVTKNKIADTNAKKIATATIKHGVVTITAKGQPGRVYLWVMDTGEQGVSACCPVTVKGLPSKLTTVATASGTDKYTKADIKVSYSIDVYLNPMCGTVKATAGTYTATVASAASDYFRVSKVSSTHFRITAIKLKNNKKVSGKITFKCDQNGKKAVFTATAIKTS